MGTRTKEESDAHYQRAWEFERDKIIMETQSEKKQELDFLISAYKEVEKRDGLSETGKEYLKGLIKARKIIFDKNG